MKPFWKALDLIKIALFDSDATLGACVAVVENIVPNDTENSPKVPTKVLFGRSGTRLLIQFRVTTV